MTNEDLAEEAAGHDQPSEGGEPMQAKVDTEKETDADSHDQPSEGGEAHR